MSICDTRRKADDIFRLQLMLAVIIDESGRSSENKDKFILGLMPVT